MPGGRPLALLFDGVYYHYVGDPPPFPHIFSNTPFSIAAKIFTAQIFLSASARFARSGPRLAGLRQQNFSGDEKCAASFLNVQFF